METYIVDEQIQLASYSDHSSFDVKVIGHVQGYHLQYMNTLSSDERTEISHQTLTSHPAFSRYPRSSTSMALAKTFHPLESRHKAIAAPKESGSEHPVMSATLRLESRVWDAMIPMSSDTEGQGDSLIRYLALALA